MSKITTVRGLIASQTERARKRALDAAPDMIDELVSIARDLNEKTADRITAATVIIERAIPKLQATTIEMDTSPEIPLDRLQQWLAPAALPEAAGEIVPALPEGDEVDVA